MSWKFVFVKIRVISERNYLQITRIFTKKAPN